MVYYNEFDPFAAAWLRELICAGHIAPGIVDERSIEDVKPADLTGYAQCHFFAGIGVWSYALRQAGWPDDKPVWTGSCPCQPFSSAGKGGGFDDERHLWPSFQWLIEQQRPTVVFGEQVASKSAGPWFDLVQSDMEALGYAFGCVPFPAAGVGAPHIRDRAYWVGHANSQPARRNCGSAHSSQAQVNGADSCNSDRLGDAGEFGARVADTGGPGLEKRISNGRFQQKAGFTCPWQTAELSSDTNGFWRDVDWLGCRDGKWRPVEPGAFPLANGITNRVGRLRGYGNAIVAPQATEFISAYLDAIPDERSCLVSGTGLY